MGRINHMRNATRTTAATTKARNINHFLPFFFVEAVVAVVGAAAVVVLAGATVAVGAAVADLEGPLRFPLGMVGERLVSFCCLDMHSSKVGVSKC